MGAVPGGRAGAERDSKCEAPAGLEVPDEEKDASHFTGISIHIQRSGKRGLFHASAQMCVWNRPFLQCVADEQIYGPAPKRDIREGAAVSGLFSCISGIYDVCLGAEHLYKQLVLQ